MIFETSWDDFTKDDLKLIKLLDTYEIPATFYVPVQNELGLAIVKEISDRYEIGSHTVTHPPNLREVQPEFLDHEILSSKEMLETVINKPVTKFCYPRGRYNDFVISKVKEHGYTEARTTMVLKRSMGDDPFRKPTTIHVYQRREYDGFDWLDLALGYFDKAIIENSYFHLWGHSKEIERDNNWGKLEEFFNYVQLNSNNL